MILELVAEAVAAGACLQRACEVIGVSARTVQRWRNRPDGNDLRCGPKHRPSNALSQAERIRVLQVVNSPEFRGLSPKQIVPRLADKGMYLASESTIYRLLREQGQQGRTRRSSMSLTASPLSTHVATKPNQVWSWDITYMPTTVRGRFFKLYLMMDVWSRKAVGWCVHEDETAEQAAALVKCACAAEHVDREQLVLHADNGAPMRGSTMLATLQWLGVMPSFGRPGVCNDNPYSEALFRTLKHTPAYPRRPFDSLSAAQRWVERFVRWYNEEHLHSAIGFVTPNQRHDGSDGAVFANRARLYESARRRHPERWSRHTRPWTANRRVELNPKPARTAA